MIDWPRVIMLSGVSPVTREYEKNAEIVINALTLAVTKDRHGPAGRQATPEEVEESMIVTGAAPMPDGAEPRSALDLVAAERRRQVTDELYDHHHDAQHTSGELAMAAAIYLIPRERRYMIVGGLWPFEPESYKPGDGSFEGRIGELTKAGALVLAEIDRLIAWATE